MIRFPYSRPEILEEDIERAIAVLRGKFLTQGPQVEAFETALMRTLGARHAVACSNGTTALHLAYLAARLEARRGLVCPAITFLATANAARMCEAPVHFADVDPDTGNVTPATIEQALRTAPFPIGAVAVVHLGGRPCDMPAIRDIARRHGVAVVEDACHAPGATYIDAGGAQHGIGACAHADLATFSFHAIKHVSMGEGGAVCTNDPELAARMRVLRSHGMTRDPRLWREPPEAVAPWYYEMPEIGFNYRLPDMLCALGISQLGRLAANLDRRRWIAARYEARLGNHALLRTPAPAGSPDGHGWHLYAVQIDFERVGRTRGAVMTALSKREIGTQVHYIPLYRQPYYADRGATALPGAEAYYARTLSLPMYAQLGESDVDEIAAAVMDALAR
ncbi:MAG: UDP-4-amino-4,6-dideoxy-N-acetyl-beta-L-altrosamine transaminase [Alphaproteobacteria bacterium]|nr:UDP-4-amino-4,6-dideoxy-N-acetyl-beta-L-altrosamine transaminase [Alphaproteobacteria bacterium]